MPGTVDECIASDVHDRNVAREWYRRGMSDRGRVALIFGAVALVAGGAGFYFFKIYGPAQELKAAQEEITRWEERYQGARACLLGKSPGSAKTSEALAIREMAPDPWDRGKCTPAVSKLSRGEGNDTGIPGVEAAWTALDKAAQKAALAFAKHVSSSTTLVDNPLPGALDELDAARLALRKAAEMPADTQAGKALEVAQIVPLVDGADPLTELRVDAIPSASGLVLFGGTANRQVQIAIAPGGTPKVARLGPGSIRGVPDSSWGATPSRLFVRGKGKTRDTKGDVKVGAMDAEGAIATPSTLEVAVPLPDQGRVFDAEDVIEEGDPVGSIVLATVVGSLAEGAIVYGGYRTLAIARAKEGTVTADPPIQIDVATASTDLDGRAAMVWSTLDKVHKALIVKPGGDETFELPESFAGAPCLTKDRAFVMASAPEVFAFGGGKPLARHPVSDFSGLQGCTADAAIVRVRRRPREVAVCTSECRKVVIPSGAPESSALTVVGGKLRAIATHAGVLGVWSEDAPPRFYALPVQAKPVRAYEWPAMALTDGKVIDIIARGGNTFVVIRIPVS